MNDGVDVVILTSTTAELEELRKVDTGAVPGSSWQEAFSAEGLPIYRRSFVVEGGPPLRVEASVSGDAEVGAIVSAMVSLIKERRPRWIAMCGVCSGDRDHVQLGDVIVADRVFRHDTGRQTPDGIQRDLESFKLRDDWKIALQRLEPRRVFADEPWLRDRPRTQDWQDYLALIALRDRYPAPWSFVDPGATDSRAWFVRLEDLRARGLLTQFGDLTEAGQRFLDERWPDNHASIPDITPTGPVSPMRLHVAPIATGARALQLPRAFDFMKPFGYRTSGLDRTSAAIYEIVHRYPQHRLAAVVLKGVADFAEETPDERFKQFAARASAECTIYFFRDLAARERGPGFDHLLPSGAMTPPSGSVPPSTLLLAGYAHVPWYGRADTLAALDTWADSDASIATKLIYADGGAGKTRLAIEWVGHRRARHDVAGFAPRRPTPFDQGWLTQLASFGPRLIIVIDYPETRADLLALLAELATFAAASPHTRLRVLLLARNDGDWWSTTRQHAPLLRNAPVHTLRLPPLATTASERAAIYCAAYEAFAPTSKRTRAPPSLVDARFAHALYLHIAAFIAANPSPSAPENENASPLDQILAHEEQFWIRKVCDRDAIAVDIPLARQLVAAATLRGGFATRDDVQDALQRIERRAWGVQDKALISLLHDLYAASDPTRYLPALAPDLLGEALVARAASATARTSGPGWIARVLHTSDDDTLTTAFIMLGRASVEHARVLRPWIEVLLASNLVHCARLAIRAAKAIGQRTASSPLGDILTDVLARDGTHAIANALEDEPLPHATVSMRRLAAWQSGMMCAALPLPQTLQDHITRARRMHNHALRLISLGDRVAALAAAREAVRNYRILALEQPDLFLHEHAIALDCLGNVFAINNQFERAVEASRATQLAVLKLGASRVVTWRDYASFLFNMAQRSHEAGDDETALAALQGAEHWYREQADTDWQFKARVAGCQLLKGRILIERGITAEAVPALEECVSLFQLELERSPDGAQSLYAAGLRALSRALGLQHDRARALPMSLEAVDLYRALVQRAPGAFEPELADALSNASLQLFEQGRLQEAFVLAEESNDIYHTLAEQGFDVHAVSHARCHFNLAHIRRAMGDDRALDELTTAVEIAERVYVNYPYRILPTLIITLWDQSLILDARGQRTEAVESARRVVKLARQHRNDEQNGAMRLASSIDLLAELLERSEQRDCAVDAAREAIEQLPASTDSSGSYVRLRIQLIHNLGRRYYRAERWEEAEATLVETADLLISHAIDAPQLYSAITIDLISLGITMHARGDQNQALRIAQQARRHLCAQPSMARVLDDCLTLIGLIHTVRREPELALRAFRDADALGTNSPELRAPRLRATLDIVYMLHECLDLDEALVIADDALVRARALDSEIPETDEPFVARFQAWRAGMLFARQQVHAAFAASRDTTDRLRVLGLRIQESDPAILAIELVRFAAIALHVGEVLEAKNALRERQSLEARLSERHSDGLTPLLNETAKHVIALRAQLE